VEKITHQIKFIGGALSFIIMTILLSILYINQTSKKDSIVINIAGKQRMLTQKISKAVFRLSTAENMKEKCLSKAIDEFDTNLNDLINGNKKRGLYSPPTKIIKDQLLDVKELWTPFKNTIDKFHEIISKLSQTKKYVYEKNIVLLTLSDSIVKEMVKNSISGKYIDLSGRQRMLSQRMMSHLLLYLNSPNPQYYSEFFNTYKMYDETIKKFNNTKELTNIPKLKKLIEDNLIDYVAMDLKAPLDKYDLIVGVQPDVETIKNSISILMQGKLPYEFRTTIVPELLNKDDIKIMGEVIKGAQQWYLQQFISDTDLVNKDFEGARPYTEEELRKIEEIGRAYVKLCELRGF